MPSGGQNAIPFDQDVADAICEWMAEGKSLQSWIKTQAEDTKTASGHVIRISTVYRWMSANEKFAAQYAQAKLDRADTLVDEMFEIASDATDDAYVETLKDGTKVAKIDGRAIRRAQLEIDVRKWAAEKMSPAHYGARIDLTSGGRAIGAPIKDAAERLHQIMLAAMARQAGEMVPAVTVDAKFVEVEALPAPAVPSMDELLS